MENTEKDRPLTPAEARRTEALQELSATLERDGWRRTDLTASLESANVFACVAGGLISVPFVVAFACLHGIEPPEIWQLGAFLVASLALVPVHEGLHGITWACLAPGHFAAIEFGFIKEYLTPYCTNTEPMGRGAYLAGVFAPFVVLGLGLACAALVLGNGVVLALGVAMILGAGGDLLVAAKLLQHGKPTPEQLCVDHPSQCGLVVFER